MPDCHLPPHKVHATSSSAAELIDKQQEESQQDDHDTCHDDKDA